jgi:protocatechuate 3,4-dioxygenase, beta subunit
MKKITYFSCVLLLLMFFIKCTGQSKNSQSTKPAKAKLIGGGCDGCELMYIDMPSTINAVDSSAGWREKGQKLLITGTVYKIDGKTPAPGVIIYYWQTDDDGYYSKGGGTNEAVKRHGHIRGWVKTGQDGKYSIYTIRPAPYPGQDMPAHIHTSIKEPGDRNEYYIDEFVFDDDKMLTGKKRRSLQNRGGSGVLRVLLSGDLQIAEHNIILGLNIPNYPEHNETQQQSGLQIGEDNPSFTPYHAWGPDKGTKTCPVCKYGRYHGIVYFVGNKPDWDDIKKWLAFLDQESVARSKYLKAYFVYGNEDNFNKEERIRELEQIGRDLNLGNIALTFVPSITDKESEVSLNKINPSVKNTFVVFKNSAIVDKFVDLKATAENFKLIAQTLDKTRGNYFNLSAPAHD